jgi:beta-lactam-binding protein with PASTA domain
MKRIDDKCWQDQPAANTVVDQEPKALTPVAVDTQVQVTIGIQKSN